MSRYYPRRQRPGGRDYLLQEELADFFAAIPADKTRDKALFHLMYAYGLRASEPGLLLLDDVDLRARRIYIRRCKSSVTKSYDIEDDETITVLRDYIQDRGSKGKLLFPGEALDKPLSRFRVYNLMQQYGKKSGLHKGLRFSHIFKHSLGTHLNAMGMRPNVIQDILGHKRLTSTQRYLGITDEDRFKLKQARAKLLRGTR